MIPHILSHVMKCNLISFRTINIRRKYNFQRYNVRTFLRSCESSFVLDPIQLARNEIC